MGAIPKAPPANSVGPAADAQGRAVIDPTANVISLVEAGVKRQDDLRELAALCAREIADVRAVYEERLRLQTERMTDIRADYEEKLRIAESKRIDAIRTVDVAAVGQAASVSATQATTLAAQVSASAETLRNTVAASATAAASALAAALAPIQKSIDDLRQTQYQQQGQQAQRADARTERGEGRDYLGLLVAAAGAAAATYIAVHH